MSRDSLDGREFGGEWIHVSVWLSALCCAPETTTTLLINHAAAKSLQSCLTLCDPTEASLPGSSVHGSFQARVLEWVAHSNIKLKGEK